MIWPLEARVLGRQRLVIAHSLRSFFALLTQHSQTDREERELVHFKGELKLQVKWTGNASLRTDRP